MNALTTISRYIDRFTDMIGKVVSWLAIVLCLVGAFNAIARFTDRYIGSSLSSNTLLEASWYLFAALFLFAAGYTLRTNAHVRVDIFYTRLTIRGKAWVDLLGTIFLLLPFCVLLLWAVWPSFVESYLTLEASPDPGGLPRWPIKGAVPLGVALLMIQGIGTLFSSLAVLTDRSDRSGGAGNG